MYGECIRWFEKRGRQEDRDLAEKLAAAGWGLFFIWVGIALFMDFGWAVGLLGVGIITLAGQAARKVFNLRLEVFWITIGLCFALGGAWRLYGVELPMVPMLLIMAGMAVLLRSFWPRGQQGNDR